jgi:hypothetical protein
VILVTLFWIGVAGVLYPYFGYPLLLWVLGKVVGRQDTAVAGEALPRISMIIPVHNEASRVGRKIVNTAALDYPAERLEVLWISDGSTDDTVPLIRASATPAMRIVELAERGGKAAALNAGLANASHEVLVFSDASIELEPGSLRQIVRRFQDPAIGCISGEDRIAGSGGEAMYGRYELLLRRLESDVHSIVGASGSFYAQRKAICAPFTEGHAPDFLSVLRTVEQGYRAVTEANAVGSMTSVKDPRQEFERKVRTLIRGLTTLFAHAGVLNPFRHGLFAFEMVSHKLMRWLAPVFLLIVLLAPIGLLGSPFYLAAFVAQVAFYVIALGALWQIAGLHRLFVGKLALYFASVNLAILVAWVRYSQGVRQELWTPSHR